MVHNHHPWFPPFDESRLAFAIETTAGCPCVLPHDVPAASMDSIFPAASTNSPPVNPSPRSC
ncbi:MAG: hypothetical protein CM1200mP2_03870 [Planctomycetaceae bacterium]|nr:MAG: hypothetical protein CM1200mP2_03870 [Planctomycetaceae bacterium]